MPELPEVETIKNDLKQLVLGRRIDRAYVLAAKLVTHPSTDRFQEELAQQRILAVERRGKLLLLRLSSGKILVIRLTLTGELLLAEPQEPTAGSTRMVIELNDGRQLRLVDRMHLARASLLGEADLAERLAELGPEANSPDFTQEEFTHLLRSHGRQIKALLLDQHAIAGLGSIYTDEALFAARVHPMRPANGLTDEEAGRLYKAIRRILAAAIAQRGTSYRAYRDVLGRKGHYQDQLKVVGREGQRCDGCGGTVQRIWVGSRETFLCPSCQLLEKPEQKAA